MYLDALFVKMRHEGRVENRAVFVGIGVTQEGTKEVLGLWTSATEGAKLWLQILTELRNRGVQDILVACVDGLRPAKRTMTSASFTSSHGHSRCLLSGRRHSASEVEYSAHLR